MPGSGTRTFPDGLHDSPLEGDGFEPSVPRALDGNLSSLAMRVLQAGR
jgi:hypothetical protein